MKSVFEIGYRYCKICMKKRREQYNKKRKVK